LYSPLNTAAVINGLYNVEVIDQIKDPKGRTLIGLGISN